MENDDPVVAAATATLGETRRHETEVAARDFHFFADEPSEGVEGVGPTPTEYLLIALASCTAITLRQYADRKYDYAGDIKVDVRYHEPRTEGAERYLQRTIWPSAPPSRCCSSSPGACAPTSTTRAHDRYDCR
jgi:uncharacterized OsmC-like protein